MAILVALAVVSIWFDDPARLATRLGLVTVGLAFALKKLIAALAALSCLRGQTSTWATALPWAGCAAT